MDDLSPMPGLSLPRVWIPVGVRQYLRELSLLI